MDEAPSLPPQNEAKNIQLPSCSGVINTRSQNLHSSYLYIASNTLLKPNWTEKEPAKLTETMFNKNSIINVLDFRLRCHSRSVNSSTVNSQQEGLYLHGFACFCLCLCGLHRCGQKHASFVNWLLSVPHGSNVSVHGCFVTMFQPCDGLATGNNAEIGSSPPQLRIE